MLGRCHEIGVHAPPAMAPIQWGRSHGMGAVQRVATQTSRGHSRPCGSRVRGGTPARTGGTAHPIPAPEWHACCVNTGERRSRRHGPVAVAILALVAAAVAGCGPSLPSASPPVPATVAASITTGGLGMHLEALERIALENGGTRGTGTPGDAATAAYASEVLAAAGYTVTEDAFDTPTYLDPGGNQLAVLGPGGPAFEDGRDFRAMLFSARATVEGPVVAIGWDAQAKAPDGAGCAASDYLAVPDGAIVLVRPGECPRRAAVALAQGSGAAALVTAVPWSGRDEVRQTTLVEPATILIPALAATREVGEALAAAAASGGRARIVTTGTVESRGVRSVFAELPGSDPDRVVMVGAHLDSAMNGPGINDDGSGIAALLELARALAGTRPEATIRFALWAAEEPGLKGSSRYVTSLEQAQRDGLVAYLNVDMLGSPNGFIGVYDDAGAAPGSSEIRDRFGADLEAAGLAWEPVDTGGGSDHRPFMVAGVPTGGLFSGAAGIISPEQAERYGTTAGQPPDPCYHLACDDLANVDQDRLEELARSLARVVVELAAEGPGAPSTP
jgi:Zn-dependent M28 family amino/carboxypeptidase